MCFNQLTCEDPDQVRVQADAWEVPDGHFIASDNLRNINIKSPLGEVF